MLYDTVNMFIYQRSHILNILWIHHAVIRRCDIYLCLQWIQEWPGYKYHAAKRRESRKGRGGPETRTLVVYINRARKVIVVNLDEKANRKDCPLVKSQSRLSTDFVKDNGRCFIFDGGFLPRGPHSLIMNIRLIAHSFTFFRLWKNSMSFFFFF